MRDIFRKSVWLFGAQILGKGIGFFYTIFVARTLGVVDFGLYSVALAFFSLFSTLAEFGFNRYLVREVALDDSRTSQLLFNISTLRILIAAFFYILMSVFLYATDPDKIRVGLTVLATLAVFPVAIAQTLDGVFVAIQKLQFSAIALVFLNISTALIGAFLLMNGFGPFGVVLALILGQLVYAGVLLYLYKKQKLKVITSPKPAAFKKIVYGSLPYGIIGILGLIYFRIDTVLLSYLRGNFETGIYTAGYKFLDAVIFIPTVFALTMFPTMAKLHETDKMQMKGLLFKSTLVLGVISVFFSLGYIMILPFVINIFLPNYSPAISVVKVLALSIPFIFMSTPGSQLILSSNRYLKGVVTISIFTVLFNIVANLIFIPLYGFMAAAWITVASDVVSFVFLVTFIRFRVFKQ